MSDSADKRTVSTDALETLGTIIGPDEKRDAIHLAVYPAMAGQDLDAGDHVTLELGVAHQVTPSDPKALGIVDPFLKVRLHSGDRFWLVIYPRQIKSLRHVWEHPAFPPSNETDQAPPGPQFTNLLFQSGAAKSEPPTNHLVKESERWLRDFCDKWADCPGYEAVMAEAARHAAGQTNSWDDDYLHFDGRDAHGEIPREFWDHFEIVTGTKVHPDHRAGHFSCSC